MQTTVTVPGYMGKPWDVTGDMQAGLILHKMGRSWVLTHAGSGCRVGTGWRLQRDAKAARARLFDVLADWTAPDMGGLAMSANMDNREFADACRKAAY